MVTKNEVLVLEKLSASLKATTEAIVKLGCDRSQAEKIKTTFMLQCRKTPKLLNCTMGSLVQAFTDAGTIGLEPDGINAHLIPYGSECTYMPDYKGYIRLAKESGEVADMTANCVRKNDDFEHEYGSNKHLKHIKKMGTDKERGVPVAAYSYVKFKDGSEDFRVLTEGEVMAAKKSSKTSAMWDKWPDAMWAKTAIRQHAKFLPRVTKLQVAADLDEANDLIEADIAEAVTSKTDDNKTRLKEKLEEKKAEKVGASPSSELPFEDRIMALCQKLNITPDQLQLQLDTRKITDLGSVLIESEQEELETSLISTFKK